MGERKHFISIWLFIGLLLLIYGLLIVGSGIYDLISPPEQPTVLANLHPQLWWGGLLVILGAIYTYTFFPRREE